MENEKIMIEYRELREQMVDVMKANDNGNDMYGVFENIGISKALRILDAMARKVDHED